MITATTAQPEPLDMLADAYRAHRDAVDALTPIWQALRDPGQPWRQTLMRLHDQHHLLTTTAEKLSHTLANTAEWFRVVGGDRTLADTLDGDARFAAITVAPFTPRGVTVLAAQGWFYLVHNADQADDVMTDAQRLIDQQRRYITDALAPASR